MTANKYSFFLVALLFAIPVGSALVTGCSKNETTAQNPGGPGAGGPGSQMRGPGGPGGPGGRGGGRFAPVSASATAPEIYQQKCAGCHGDHGQGVRGPNLAKVSGDPDDELYQTIHNGKGRMPAFGNQMTEAQIKQLVTYVKKFGAPK